VGRWLTSRPGRFTPREKDLVPIVQEAGWAPGPVWAAAENLSPPGFDLWTFQPVTSLRYPSSIGTESGRTHKYEVFVTFHFHIINIRICVIYCLRVLLFLLRMKYKWLIVKDVPTSISSRKWEENSNEIIKENSYSFFLLAFSYWYWRRLTSSQAFFN
jgi:hypothetical protein